MVKDWGNRLICRIDVTGFLSIQVALLVMFMVLYGPSDGHSRLTVEMPKAHHSVSMLRAEYEDALIVTVMRDGKIYIDSLQVRSPNELKDRLQDGVRQGSEKRVYINADERVHYRAVAQVLDQVRLAGIEKVSFLTSTPR